MMNLRPGAATVKTLRFRVRPLVPLAVGLGIALLAPLSATPTTSHAREAAQTPRSNSLVIGKPMRVISALCACGPLETRYPFDPATYGKIGGHNPLGRNSAKIALITHVLDAHFFQLAAAVDALVAGDQTLAESQVIVIDDTGAQRGGYTVEQVQERRKAIRDLAEKNKITHLSFFLATSSAGSMLPQLGMGAPQPADATNPADAAQATGTADPNVANILLAYLVPNPAPGRFAILKWSTTLQSRKLDPATVPEIIGTLQKAIAEK